MPNASSLRRTGPTAYISCSLCIFLLNFFIAVFDLANSADIALLDVSIVLLSHVFGSTYVI